MSKTLAEAMPDYRVELKLSPVLYQWLMGEAARQSLSVDQVIQRMLEEFAQTEEPEFDITRTRTWQLRGTFKVSNPDIEYVVGRDAEGQEITNYAEHVDDVLYRGS